MMKNNFKKIKNPIEHDEQMFYNCNIQTERGIEMTAIETNVLNMIQQSKDPIKAMEVAVKVILDFLTPPQSYPQQEPADLRVSVGTE